MWTCCTNNLQRKQQLEERHLSRSVTSRMGGGLQCTHYLYTHRAWVCCRGPGPSWLFYIESNTHTHTRLTALFPGLPGWAGTRKVKPIWILLKQETVSGSGISWAMCTSAPRSRQITMPAPHQSVFYRPDALRAAQPTESKHWRDLYRK